MAISRRHAISNRRLQRLSRETRKLKIDLENIKDVVQLNRIRIEILEGKLLEIRVAEVININDVRLVNVT